MSASTDNGPVDGVAPAQSPADETTEAPARPAPEPSNRVYFGKIARGTTEEQVKEYISAVGETELISVHERTIGGRYSHFAFATYKSLEDAKKAVDLNDTDFNGRNVLVEFAKSEEVATADREARIEKRKEARKAREESLKAKAAANGEVVAEGEGGEAPKPKKKTKAKKPRRRQPEEGGEEAEEGQVEDSSKARIDAESGEDGVKTGKKPRKPRAPRTDKKLVITDEEDKGTIFVSNLPFSVTDATLADIFNNLSIQTKRAKVVTRTIRSGNVKKSRSKGFGFVELEDESQKEEAVQKVNGTLIEGRNISAKVAKIMKPIDEVAGAEGESAPAAEGESAEPATTTASAALTAENIEKVNASGPNGGW